MIPKNLKLYFIASVTSHIPNRNETTLRYFKGKINSIGKGKINSIV